MALEFDRLGEVEALSEVPEGANVLGEVDGEIVRLPGSGLGGGGGIKTAIIKSSNYDNMLAGVMTTVAEPDPVTYSCTNMTFEEAYETMAKGEPLAVIIMRVVNDMGAACQPGVSMFAGDDVFGVPCLLVADKIDSNTIGLYWTSDGLSADEPSSGE